MTDADIIDTHLRGKTLIDVGNTPNVGQVSAVRIDHLSPPKSPVGFVRPRLTAVPLSARDWAIWGYDPGRHLPLSHHVDRHADPEVRTKSGALPYEYGSSNARVWWEYLGTPDFPEKAQALMAKARAAAPAGTVYARRVELLDRGVLRLILANRRRYAGSDSSNAPPVPEIDVPVGPEPFTENLVARMRGQGPAVLADDSLEIFIDKDPTDGKYFQLGYSTVGGILEAFIDRTPAEGALEWKSRSAALVTIQPNRSWTAEIAIPWDSISGEAIVPGQTWRLNVCRNRRAGRARVEYSNWFVCLGGFHNPARSGTITFR